MSLLSVQNINTGYGKKQVLFNVDLEVEGGETVLLVGSNGSGKSTLFKAIYGLLPLWNGKVYFDGQLLHSPGKSSIRSQLLPRGIMYIPQKDELFEDMTVEENLRMSLLYLNDKKTARNKIRGVFANLEVLNKNKGQLASKLSGGERKLLSLGMVMLNQPKLLLHDEPLAGLSGNNISVALSWLRKIQKKDTTIVLIEHNINELLHFSDKIMGLNLGQISKNKITDFETFKSYLL